jgi:membrane peptidoglycan carboxypeptidase
MPENYDHNFRGPMSLRNALAQSINIPSIKTLYLAGLKDTLQTAQDMGISSLKDPNQYGLTLVLGGGEVSLLEMTSGYSTFANNGVRNEETGLLKVTDKNNKVLEEYKSNPTQAIPAQSALLINDILHDNNARMPLNGPGSATDFPDREVALKTGTTNDSRDAWIIGYTPQIVVGAWAGNNNNTPMVKKTSGLIIAPLWRAFMNDILPTLPPVSFVRPEPIDPNLKPILRGVWQGGQTYTIDKSSGLLATDFTPPELREERAVGDVHTILYWVDRSDPKGPPPAHPENDSQFNLWEIPVRAWANAHNGGITSGPPSQVDPNHTGQTSITFVNPTAGSKYSKESEMQISISYQVPFNVSRVEYSINNTPVGTAGGAPYGLAINLRNVANLKPQGNDLKVVVFNGSQAGGEAHTTFDIGQ